MVYWVIARPAAGPGGDRARGPGIERFGPFESERAASRARAMLLPRYRGRPARIEVRCDFS